MEANLWSGEQKSYQATVKDKVAKQTEANNYLELTMVNGRWDGEKVTCGTQGGLVSGWKQSKKSVSNNEWREVSRGHSSKMVANILGRSEL